MRLSDRGFLSARALSYSFAGTAGALDSALTAVITHNLGALPNSIELWLEVSAGNWEARPPGTYIRATSTTLIPTATTLTSAFGAGANVRLIASTGAAAISVNGAIVDGGNTLGAPITIGTNDNFGLNLETNGTTRLSIANSGLATFNNGLTVSGTTTLPNTVVYTSNGSIVKAGNFAHTLTTTATSDSTFPAGTHTLAALGLAQTFTAAQTFSGGISGSTTISGNVTAISGNVTSSSTSPTFEFVETDDSSNGYHMNTNGGAWKLLRRIAAGPTFTEYMNVSSAGAWTLGPSSVPSGLYHIANGTLVSSNAGGLTGRGYFTGVDVAVGANVFRDAAATKALTTVTGYTTLALSRTTSASGEVFSLDTNYQDAQTANSAVVTTNTRQIMSATAAGAVTLGPSSGGGRHLFQAAALEVVDVRNTIASGTQVYTRYYNESTLRGLHGATSTTALTVLNQTSNTVGTISQAGAVNFGNIHNIGAGNVTSGRYTPTVTEVANVTSGNKGTPQSGHYVRVGNTVTVSVRIENTTPSIASPTDTRIRISLPISSNLSNGNDVSGVAGFFRSSATITNVAGTVLADTTNNQALIIWMANSTGGTNMNVTFQYEVK